MSWELDPQVAQALAPVFEAMGSSAPPVVGDVQSRRTFVEALMGSLMSGLPAGEGVEVSSHTTTAPDGAEIAMRLFAPAGAAGGPLVLYIHGGGMILGSVDLYEPLLRLLAASSGVALLAVDYRLAPEYPHPVPVEDCYTGLRWAAQHAADLGYDPSRLAVVGDSAGGGLAAGTALIARDRGGPSLTRQILIYPMLDDRNTVPPSAVPDVLVWSYDDNATGWGALLGDQVGGSDVAPYAAPARAQDLVNLPATYIMVGDIDIFLREDLDYAARLSAAGVPVELHVHPGGCHGFDVFAHSSELGRRAHEDELRVLRSL
jgi:acetyl esterase/lipase